MAILNIPTGDPLAFSQVQAFFDRLYPTTNGFAIENLGNVSQRQGDFFAWPTGSSEVYGENGITYSPATTAPGSAITSVGILTNNTGSAIDLTNARIDVDLNFVSLSANDQGATVRLRVIGPEPTLAVSDFDNYALLGQVSVTRAGRATLTATLTGGADASWSNGDQLGLYFDSDDSSRTYTVTVRNVRFSRNSTEFQRNTESLSDYNRGGSIVPSWPSVGGITLTYPTNSLTLTDSNAADTGWTTATPVLSGATTGWTYNPETTAVVDGQSTLVNTLLNNTGSTVLGTLGHIELDLNVTNIMAEGSTTQTQANILARPVNNTSAGGFTFGSAGNSSFRVQDHQLNMGMNTVTLTRVGTFSIANTNGIRFAIVETDENFTPFTVEIVEIRISFTNTAFTEINTGISTDGTMLSLSSFRGVDDGRN